MRIKINASESIKPYNLDSVGVVTFSPFSLKVGASIDREIEGKVEECDSEKYVEIVLSLTLRIDDRRVSKEDLNKIKKTDKEKIIKHFIDESGMNRERVAEDSVDESGNIIKNIKYGDVKYPKEANEDIFSYYHRLRIIEQKDFAKKVRALNDKIKHSFHFSDKLNTKIGDIFKYNFPKYDIFKNNLEIPTISENNFEMPIIKDQKLDALNTMNNKMDKSIELTALMLNEIKGSTKKNTGLTYFIIFINLLFGITSIAMGI